MSRPTGIAVLLVAVVATAAGSVVTAVAHASGASPTTTARQERLVVAAECAAPTGSTAPKSTVPGATVVTFEVPARTYVRVDAAGAPVAAMTNTLCPPAASDQVVLVDSDGRAVTGVDVRPAEQRWSGDWTRAGAWHAWPST